MTKKKNVEFSFIVSDGYCSYEYPLDLSTENSVDSIANKIYEAFELQKKEGKRVRRSKDYL